MAAQAIKLTDEQRQLAEDNYGLLFGYAIKHNIDLEEDDNYGILATGLCQAAQKYNPDKGAFSTLVYFAMTNELRKNHTIQTYGKRDVRKLDKLKDGGEICTYKRIDESRECEDLIHGELACYELLNYLKANLTPRRYSIIGYLVQGYTREEIGEILNISHQAVTANVKVIKDTIKEYYKENNHVRRS